MPRGIPARPHVRACRIRVSQQAAGVTAAGAPCTNARSGEWQAGGRSPLVNWRASIITGVLLKNTRTE